MACEPDQSQKGAQDSVKLIKNKKTGKNSIANPDGALYFTIFFVVTFGMVMFITWNNAKKKMFGADIRVPWQRVQEDDSESVNERSDEFNPPSILLSNSHAIATVSSTSEEFADRSHRTLSGL